MSPPISANSKVFISYSHDSPDHESRVLALSDRLRREGIDAILDQYESQRKRGETARLDLRNTAPVLDPTSLREVSENRAHRQQYPKLLGRSEFAGSHTQSSEPVATNQ